MTEPDVWLSPAKINLFLHITGRRPDGMHELQTAFQFIDLCDQLSFTVNDSGVIQRAAPVRGVSEQDDLTLRAARLLQQSTGTSAGVTIALKKIIPLGGGLGGASSNAATTLHALNRLWQLQLEEAELLRLAADLGADVPIFVLGKAAWAEGVGEKLTPLNLATSWYLIADTGTHVSTRELFADSQLTRNSPQLTICPPEPGAYGNVFEPIVRARYPAINAVFNWLQDFSTPFLTGTGGCVVAPLQSKNLAIDIQARAPQGVNTYIVQGKNISALKGQLSA